MSDSADAISKSESSGKATDPIVNSKSERHPDGADQTRKSTSSADEDKIAKPQQHQPQQQQQPPPPLGAVPRSSAVGVRIDSATGSSTAAAVASAAGVAAFSSLREEHHKTRPTYSTSSVVRRATPISASVERAALEALRLQQAMSEREGGDLGGCPEGSGGVGWEGTKTRQFKKAKSAATFMLDGVSYTIVASPPPTPKSAHDVSTSWPTATTTTSTQAASLVAAIAATTAGVSSSSRPASASAAVATTSGGSSSSNDPLHKGGTISILRRSMSGGQTAKKVVGVSQQQQQQQSRAGPLIGSVLSPSPKQQKPSNGNSGGTVPMETGTCDLLTAEHVDGPQMCCQRLRTLLSKVESNDIKRDELKSQLEYVVTILDAVFFDEQRTGFEADDEDDELSRVEADAVPNEVRDWLAQTFTRSTSGGAANKRNADNKPRFRSVANAIRAGILVDRIYRRISAPVGLSIPQNVAALLKNLDNWSFDVFSVNVASDGNALKYVGYELLQRYDLIAKFKISIPVLESFLMRLQQGYSKYGNPYHNLVHAADVTQTMHYVISRGGLTPWMTDVELLAAIVAALIHDFEHTGTTNAFHVNTGSEVALLYNDKAVLENHHVSAAFRLMKEDEHNIVSSLKPEEYREFRNMVIDVVLATDMSYHFQQIKNMKSHLITPESIDKTKALSLIVHCADISHPSKAWELHHRWTDLLIQEFFRQGDREELLGLPISPLCDRKNTLVAESQIGFIDFIVDPSLQVMGDMVDKMVESLQQQQQQAAAAASEASASASSDTASAGTGTTANVTSPRAPVPRMTSQTSIQSPDCEPWRPWERCLVNNKYMWKERSARGWISPLQEARSENDDAAKSQPSSAAPVSTLPSGTPHTDRSSTSNSSAISSSTVMDDPTDDSGVESPGIRGVPSPMPTPTPTSAADSSTSSSTWLNDSDCCSSSEMTSESRLSNGPGAQSDNRPLQAARCLGGIGSEQATSGTSDPPGLRQSNV